MTLQVPGLIGHLLSVALMGIHFLPASPGTWGPSAASKYSCNALQPWEPPSASPGIWALLQHQNIPHCQGHCPLDTTGKGQTGHQG
jgi:hypothetical protein